MKNILKNFCWSRDYMENLLKKPTFRKIEYYLYNYDYIDVKIENIRFDMDSPEYNQNYYKYIKNKSSSLEDQVIRNIGIEQRIYKLNKWKNLITFVLRKYKETNILNYDFIDLKYFRRAHPITIQKELGLSIKEQKDIQAEILQYIFFLAIEKGGELVLIKFRKEGDDDILKILFEKGEI